MWDGLRFLVEWVKKRISTKQAIILHWKHWKFTLLSFFKQLFLLTTFCKLKKQPPKNLELSPVSGTWCCRFCSQCAASGCSNGGRSSVSSSAADNNCTRACSPANQFPPHSLLYNISQLNRKCSFFRRFYYLLTTSTSSSSSSTVTQRSSSKTELQQLSTISCRLCEMGEVWRQRWACANKYYRFKTTPTVWFNCSLPVQQDTFLFCLIILVHSFCTYFVIIWGWLHFNFCLHKHCFLW